MATEISPEKNTEGEGHVSGEIEEDFELQTKRKRRQNVNNETPAAALGDAADEVRSSGEDIRSVYFEDDEGTKDFSSDSSSSRSTEAEFFVTEKKLQNGNSASLEIFDDLQSVPEEGAKQDLSHIKLGNGLNSYIASVDNGANEIVVATEPENQSHVHTGIKKVAKLDVSVLDLEKVLEEQETHDLFCPNCHSCITKRVILCKRKRRVPDIEHEERPGKLHIKPKSVATSVEIVENEPEVFRCLSCFSLFIPTENGFNIFRIFRKKEESVNVQVPDIQSSGQTSARDGNWPFSIFKADSSKIKGNEAEADRLPPQLGVSIGAKLEENQGASALPISVSARTEESYASNGNANSVKFSSGEDQLLNDNKTAPTPPASEVSNIGGNYATDLNIISGDGKIRTVITSKPAISGRIDQNNHDVVGMIPPLTILLPQEDDTIKPISIVQPSSHGTIKDPSTSISTPTSTVFVPLDNIQINIGNPILGETRKENEWEVLKSIVYGGLIESIASLGVVSSAAGAETSTLNIVALGLANLIGGFFVILHDLSELKSSANINRNEEPTGRYWKLLGRKSNFGLHATVVIISYILFGLLPPIVYGFSFRKSDDKEYKLIVVAASSLLCVALLAIGKAHVSEPRSYIKTFLYYLGLGITASGLSYVAGVLINRFLEQLGLFEHNASAPSPPSIDLFGVGRAGLSSWAVE